MDVLLHIVDEMNAVARFEPAGNMAALRLRFSILVLLERNMCKFCIQEGYVEHLCRFVAKSLESECMSARFTYNEKL